VPADYDYAAGLALAAPDWDRLPAPADDAALHSPLSPHMAKLVRGAEETSRAQAGAEPARTRTQTHEHQHDELEQKKPEPEQKHAPEHSDDDIDEGRDQDDEEEDEEDDETRECRSGAADEYEDRAPLVAEAAAPEPPNLIKPFAAHRGPKPWRQDRDELDAAIAADMHELKLLTVRH
jgi:cobalamin biosynthesis protein CobT